MEETFEVELLGGGWEDFFSPDVRDRTGIVVLGEVFEAF